MPARTISKSEAILAPCPAFQRRKDLRKRARRRSERGWRPTPTFPGSRVAAVDVAGLLLHRPHPLRRVHFPDSKKTMLNTLGSKMGRNGDCPRSTKNTAPSKRNHNCPSPHDDAGAVPRSDRAEASAVPSPDGHASPRRPCLPDLNGSPQALLTQTLNDIALRNSSLRRCRNVVEAPSRKNFPGNGHGLITGPENLVTYLAGSDSARRSQPPATSRPHPRLAGARGMPTSKPISNHESSSRPTKNLRVGLVRPGPRPMLVRANGAGGGAAGDANAPSPRLLLPVRTNSNPTLMISDPNPDSDRRILGGQPMSC